MSQVPYDSSVSMKAAETPKSLAMAWREERQKKKKADDAENWLENVFLAFGGCLVGDVLVFRVFWVCIEFDRTGLNHIKALE